MPHTKTVIVTGAGAGIGRAAALLFGQNGYQVVVNTLSESGRQVCDMLQAQGVTARFVQGDVSSEMDVRRIVDCATQELGGIDVLVNNAGIVSQGTIENTSMVEWDHVMAVNVRSVFLMSKYCMPYLCKTRGNVVNVASAVALKGVPSRGLYSATKGAIVALSRTMAVEYVSQGVRINCVSPGTIVTPSFLQRVEQADDPKGAMDQFIQRQPIGYLGEADDVASAIVYLASDQAKYITGTNLVMDGGMTM